MAETDVLYEFGREPGFLVQFLTLTVLKCYTWRFHWDVSWNLILRKTQISKMFKIYLDHGSTLTGCIYVSKNHLNCLKLVKSSKFPNWVYLGIYGVGPVWHYDVLMNNHRWSYQDLGHLLHTEWGTCWCHH